MGDEKIIDQDEVHCADTHLHTAHNGRAQSILATNRKDNKEACCSKSFNLTQATKQRRKNKVSFTF